MFEFEKIAHSEGMQRVYRAVVEKIDVINHPEFLDRPIKVLDLAGGIGMPGQLIRKQCEAVCGELSERDFAILVDYVNVDQDREALGKSPGRKIYQDVVNIYDELATEESFDYVLSINQNPNAPVYTAQELNQRNISDDLFNPIRLELLRSTAAIRSYSVRASLITCGLLLRSGGKYIWTGVVGKEFLNGTSKASKEFGLGLKRREEPISIDLGEKTVDLLLEFDGVEKGRKHFGKMKQLYREEYRLVVMDANGVVDKNKTIRLLQEERHHYEDWINFCEVQDKFGSW